MGKDDPGTWPWHSQCHLNVRSHKQLVHAFSTGFPSTGWTSLFGSCPQAGSGQQPKQRCHHGYQGFISEPPDKDPASHAPTALPGMRGEKRTKNTELQKVQWLERNTALPLKEMLLKLLGCWKYTWRACWADLTAAALPDPPQEPQNHRMVCVAGWSTEKESRSSVDKLKFGFLPLYMESKV